MAWPTSTHRVGSQVKRSVQAAIGREGGARRIDAKPPKNRRYRGRAYGLSATALAFTVLALAMTAPAARAAKSVSDAFGAPGSEGSAFGTPQGIAVNSTGAGGVPAGTTYVVDSTQNRVQRFGPSHDFVSAWGFDVTLPAASPDSSAEFEVCTVAVECKAGVSTISPAPGGELSFGAGGGGGVAVNQTTGDVYVTNANFLRVDEFSATGSFIRAFGKDVVQSGHLGDTGTDFEICSVAADCKSGEGGSGAGAFLDLNASYLAIAPATAPNAGDVLVSDRGNRRVSEYTATGAFVRSFGWDVVEAGPDNTAGGEFEVCNAGVDTCHIGAPGSGVGQFGNLAPTRVAEDSTGAIYTVDSRSPNFRVEKFTLPGNVVTPEGVFAGAALTATTEGTSATNIAIDGSDNVIVTKGFPAGATQSCLNTNAPSVANDRRVLELSPAGALLGTSLACIGNRLPRGLAIDSASGKIYFTSSSGPAFVYVVSDVTPPTATIEPITEFDSFSASLKGHVDPHGSLTECRFDYITKTAFEANLNEGKDGFTGAPGTSCETSAGAGTGAIAVSAQIKGTLNPNTPYKVRLVAFKAPFGDIATESPTTEFTSGAVPPPTLITGAAAPRGTVTARLNGLVNPNASPTEIHFEYGTEGPCSANPCTATATQDVGSTYVPPGEPFIAVSADLEELEPATTYYYRLAGTNEIGANAGADRTFTTLPVEAAGSCPNEEVRQIQHTDSYLADCRGIELVNNPDKGNQHVRTELLQGTPPISPDGNRAIWNVLAGAPGGNTGTGPPSSPNEPRTAGARKASSLRPPSRSVASRLAATGWAPPRRGSPRSPSRRRPGGGSGSHPCSHRRKPERDAARTVTERETKKPAGRADMTDDGAHVLFIDPDVQQLMDLGSGAPETVSLMPDGHRNECGLISEDVNNSFIGGGGAPQGAAVMWRPGYHMIATTDASRVYFQAKPNVCGGAALLGIYVRNRETEETTLIDPGTGESPNFIRAAADGRSAYFATVSDLDPADSNLDPDVYRWDEGGGESTCLTCVVSDADVLVQSLTGGNRVLVSDDLSHVYFESKKQLVAGQGKAGDLNVYALSDGEIRFVADHQRRELGRRAALSRRRGPTLRDQPRRGRPP